MSAEHPELIFVAGPQTGQRVVLNRPVIVLGRSGQADVMLSEEYCSRKQARFEMIQAGPTLENLSARGTWINGKRYKAGKKVLLETGDLIGAGKETELLFVAAGDDVEAALAMYRASAESRKNAFGRRPRPPEPPPQAVATPPAEEETPPDSEHPPAREFDRKRPPRPSEMTPEQRAAQARRARLRKIGIGLGVYLGLVGIVIVFGLVYAGNSGTRDEMPPMLTEQQIAEALRTAVERSPNPLEHQRKLQQALELYQGAALDARRLYDCVQAFKLALAYSNRAYFENVEDQRKYRDALDRLTREVASRYRQAYLLEKSREWAQAEQVFYDLLAIVHDEKNPIFRNVQAHYSRVQSLRQKTAPEKRRAW